VFRPAAAFALAAVVLSADAAPPPANRGPTPPARPAADPLPPGAIIRLGSDRFRVGGGVDQLAVSPDGTFVAVAGQAGVTVFDAATGRAVARLRDLTFTEALAFAPDGSLLTLGPRDDGRAVIGRYDPATGRLRGGAATGDYLGNNPVFSPDGSLVAAPDAEEVKVFDARTGKRLGRSVLTKDAVNVAAFSPDARWLAAVTHNNAFVVFDRLTGGLACHVKFDDPVSHFAFAPDGKRAAVALGGGTVRMVDVPAGTLGRRIRTRAGGDRVAITPAGELIVSSAGERAARVFDPATGKELRRIRGLADVMLAEVSPDGKTLAGATYTGAVRLWDVKTGKRLPQSADLPGGIVQLWFPEPGRLVGMGEGVGWLGWDVATGQQERIGPRVTADETSSIDPDGKRIVTAGPKGVRLFDAGAKKLLRTFDLDETFGPAVAWFAPGGKDLLAWGTARLRAWDLKTGKARDVEFGGKDALGLDVSPDGTRLAVALPDGTDEDPKALVRVFDLGTGKRVYDARLPGMPADLTFAPDGTRFAVFLHPMLLADDAPSLAVHLLDAATGRVVRRMAGNYVGGTGTPFSPDGRALALAGVDNTVRVLEIASGQDRAVFPHSPFGWPDAVAFAPDGLLLASAGGEVPVYVWDLRGRQAPPPPEPDAAAAEKLWRDLAADAATAYRAMQVLERHPAAAVRLFRGKVKPAATTDPAAVARWLADLDSPAYRVRAAAYRELAKAADRAGPPLRAAAARATSAEVRERLGVLLDRAERPTPDGVRLVRAAEVLEYAGTAAAKALLREWASGADGARLTAEAAGALERLK
jgi:WD40 repeat protein